MNTIGALVHRNIVRASPNDTVHSAVEKMCEQNVGAVLVMSDGSLDSIFTERDLMKRVLLPGLDSETTALRDVATSNPTTIVETASVRACAYLVRDKKFRHLPVLDDHGDLVGMISTRDFLTELAGGFEKVIQRMCANSDAEECADYYQYVVGNFVD